MASLALCALSGNFVVLSLARLIAGVGAAVAFVASGALAARIAQTQPARANFLLSLFYAGPGLGIVLSGLDRAVRARGGRAGIVVDRMVGDDAAVDRPDRYPLLLAPIDAGTGLGEAAAAQEPGSARS